jgi:hypothetical protein
MPTYRSAVGSVARFIARWPFEVGVLVLAVAYVAAHWSPSSYALAIEQLGGPAEPTLGSPRLIRSDEWAVVTPLFEAAVNNDFRETNNTSFYGETLHSFIGLPLLNWGLVFKPLMWPFFLVSPQLAYSSYWAALSVLMLVGWSTLLRAFGFSQLVASFVSAILFFSPFVQAWSGPGHLLAVFPWLLLAIVRIRSHIILAVALSALVPVWLIGLFYVPSIPPLTFLGAALLVALRPEVFAPRRLFALLAGMVAGAAITLAYFAPVLNAYADSVYPGSRWVRGGALPEWQVISQFLPGTTTERFTNLINANICEAATVATWLPLLVACTLDVPEIRRRFGEDLGLRRNLRRLGVLAAAWVTITAWQVVPLPPLSYALGLGLAPEVRTVFASGALLLIATAYALDRLPLKLTPLRLAVFAASVVSAWLAASFDLQAAADLRVRDELLVLILVAGLVPFAAVIRHPEPRVVHAAILLTVLAPTLATWGTFNPIQSTKVMFEKPDTDVTRKLDALATTRPDGAIAVTGFAGAVLNGVGYRSVTHVLAVPSPELFREYFPEMDEERFNRVFNRYAHVELTAAKEPRVTQDSLIQLPVATMARHAAVFEGRVRGG